MTQRYLKKPIPVEAEKWEGEEVSTSLLACKNFAGDYFRVLETPIPIDFGNGKTAVYSAEVFSTHHGVWNKIKDGDWVMKGPDGEFYPHDGDLFETNYVVYEGE